MHSFAFEDRLSPTNTTISDAETADVEGRLARMRLNSSNETNTCSSSGSTDRHPRQKPSWKNPALYKTRICDNWAMNQPCKFGLHCWYAHGPRELRHVPHLDDNPTAAMKSLAEVTQILPDARDRVCALERVKSLMGDANLDIFKRPTIPFLNSLAFKLMAAKNAGGSSLDAASLIKEVLRDALANQQPQHAPNSAPSFATARPTRPQKVPLNHDTARFSMRAPKMKEAGDVEATAIPLPFNPWKKEAAGVRRKPPVNESPSVSTQTKPRNANEDVDEQKLFEPIERDFDTLCDNYFT